MESFSPEKYRRDCLLGALGAILMLVGDLCLSVIPAERGDSGLFARAAYLDGSFGDWRLPLLMLTGSLGMALGFFSVRAFYMMVKPECRVTRKITLVGGVIYLTTAGVLHAEIGALADLTGRLSPLLGREETIAFIQARYERTSTAALIPYAGMVLLIIGSAAALLAGKTVLPRAMFVFHVLVWQIVFVLIPDIRQALGADPSTWDFILSQGSGNAALFIWLAANAVCAGRLKTEE